MAEDWTFAKRLRERAAEVRRPTAPGIYLGVQLDPDEADALADALEAGQRLRDMIDECVASVAEYEGAETHYGAARHGYDAALARLNARVAVKSAEGQPAS